MKFCATAALLVSLFAVSMALPANKRMAYYQQPSMYYQARSSPQRLMYLQRYVQSPPAPHTHARSTALDAEAYLKDCIHPEDAASVEKQAAEESTLNDAGVHDVAINDAEPYPAAGGQVSAEFEGTFADGGFDTGLSGAADIPAAEIPAADVPAADIPSADVPLSEEVPQAAQSAEVPEIPEAPELAEAPEAPAVDNQVLEDDVAPTGAIPEVAPETEALPSDDDAKVPREYNFDKPAEAVPEPDLAPVEAPIAEEAVPEVPELPEVPAVPSLNPEQAPAEDAQAEVAAPAEVPLAVPAEEPVAAAAPAVPAPAVPALVAQSPVAQAPAAPAVATAIKPLAVAPPKRYLPPKKKVFVKLDAQSELANDDDDDADANANAYRPARIPNARRPIKGSGNAVAAKGTKAQLPAGTFFPISFGGTSGGAIAIANSFSTGEGGSATSHAIAYGSPDVARAKARPVRRH